MKSFKDALLETRRLIPSEGQFSYGDVMDKMNIPREDQEVISRYAVNACDFLTTQTIRVLATTGDVQRSIEEPVMQLIITTLQAGLDMGESRLRDELLVPSYEQQKAAKAAEQNKE